MRNSKAIQVYRSKFPNVAAVYFQLYFRAEEPIANVLQ